MNPQSSNSTCPPFKFPLASSNVLPDPSRFFSGDLLSSPLPTNSFFQNFVLNNGDQPEYIHPYLIKLTSSSLAISYPSRFANSSYIYQIFNPDLSITGYGQPDPHVISSFSDLSVTVDRPKSNLRFFLVRGSPYITCSVLKHTDLDISTNHKILSFSSNNSKTKHTIKLDNNQKWLIYASKPIDLKQNVSVISGGFSDGELRIAVCPNSDVGNETTLDRFSSSYPVSGEAKFTNPFSLEYNWENWKGYGDLLLLAHPLHLKLLSNSGDNSCVTVLNSFRYTSIDGDLVGVVGDSWRMKVQTVPVTWNSIKGISKNSSPEIISALSKDIEALNPASISTTMSHFYGLIIARAARLALIAEEVGYVDAIPRVTKFLKDTIEPWLDGTFPSNGFLYDSKWGGIITKQGEMDSRAKPGFGLYHIGYFLYAIAVLVKLDYAWGIKYKPQAYDLMSYFMSLAGNDLYTRLRCFDLYKLHSWVSGLTEFAHGRSQQSTSEAINAYYSATLMGLAYRDVKLVSLGLTITSLEIQAAKMWWHVRSGEKMYEDGGFGDANRVVGIVWSNKRDSGLWFASRDCRECRLGIQVLPVLPITEVLFSDSVFVKELVKWTLPALSREGVGDGWRGFVYALQGVYDKDGALERIRRLKEFNDGNSLSNLLWWIHSRHSD